MRLRGARANLGEIAMTAGSAVAVVSRHAVAECTVGLFLLSCRCLPSALSLTPTAPSRCNDDGRRREGNDDERVLIPLSVSVLRLLCCAAVRRVSLSGPGTMRLCVQCGQDVRRPHLARAHQMTSAARRRVLSALDEVKLKLSRRSLRLRQRAPRATSAQTRPASCKCACGDDDVGDKLSPSSRRPSSSSSCPVPRDRFIALAIQVHRRRTS